MLASKSGKEHLTESLKLLTHRITVLFNERRQPSTRETRYKVKYAQH